MRFGLSLPIFDELADPSLLADLAVSAEAAGWDGVFIWDHLRYRAPATSATDPWIALAAIASRTERVLIGPMVTPLARRRPQVVARQIAALDHLSGGRMVFGVGVGQDTSGDEFVDFGEQTDLRTRADMLDEGLDIVTGLLAGAEVRHHGEHFTVDGAQFLPTPVQPHLPIWVAARWPNRRPLRRAARYDGVYAIELAPPDVASLVDQVSAERDDAVAGFEIVVHRRADEPAEPWQAAGVTWLLTTFDQFTVTADEARAVIGEGPSA